MVTNENELITENQEAYDDNLIDNDCQIVNDEVAVEDMSIEDKKVAENTFNSEETLSSNTETASEQKETAETNCLALTVRKNYSVSIIKNSIFTSLRLSFKVAVSTLVLNILKLFL